MNKLLVLVVTMLLANNANAFVFVYLRQEAVRYEACKTHQFEGVKCARANQMERLNKAWHRKMREFDEKQRKKMEGHKEK